MVCNSITGGEDSLKPISQSSPLQNHAACSKSFDDGHATLEWVDWFINRRLLEPIGNIPPAEAEANFYAALETEPMAA